MSQNLPARPQVNPIAVLRDLLERSKTQIALALPRHLTPERMIRLAMTAFQKDGKLAACDLKSVVAAVMGASQLGLELDGALGHAYLVPYGKTCQLIIGYKGMLALARRSGEVSTVAAHVVYSNDYFQFRYGSDPVLLHEPVLQNRGSPIAVYAVCKLKDGGADFEVAGWEEVLQWQQEFGKRPGSPWQKHLSEMSKKSIIRRLFKRMPVSTEITRAVTLDEYAESGVAQPLEYPGAAPQRLALPSGRVPVQMLPPAEEPHAPPTKDDGEIIQDHTPGPIEDDPSGREPEEEENANG